MSKAQKLFELLQYVNTKKRFTANEVAEEFNISVRTAHRYLTELSDMGVYLYTEQGKAGGYRVLSMRMLPPINFNEDEALAIFFAFQSLKHYKTIPFEIDINSVSRKLYSKLPEDLQSIVDKMESSLIFWNDKREIEAPYIKELLKYSLEKQIINIKYASKNRNKNYKIVPIGIYSNHGFWYVPAYDFTCEDMRHFRVDRILDLEDTNTQHKDLDISLKECIDSYKIIKPIRLYVTLTNLGVRECRNNPYLGDSIVMNAEGEGGYIDEIIDYSDLEYTGRFFMQLGNQVKVIEPEEMIEFLCKEARKIIDNYGE